MIVIYCDSVFDNNLVEPDYENEIIASERNDFESFLISFEELQNENTEKALKFVKPSEKITNAIYRGWMLTTVLYKKLYEGLLTKNIKLVNSPEEYNHTHYLPNSYDKIKAITPKSNWIKLENSTELISILKLASEFENKPIIIKDYVKSEKHNWEDACFIPNASDSEKVKSVVEKFLELRGKSLNEGIVFRTFEELEFLTNHSQSGMPLTKEFRIFFANKQIVSIFNYWDEGDYGDLKPNLDVFKEIAKNIESNFFTMDIAQKKNGNWIIMELGDGQVSGLPDNADVNTFYKNLNKVFEQNFI